jgi:TPR repeat protein
MYQRGEGRAQNAELAVRYFQQAAVAGEVSVFSSLAWAYYEGAGVNKNAQEALDWFLKAAEDESATAESKFMVGYLLLNSAEVDRDKMEAIKWLESAARGGYDSAHDALAQLFFFGADGVPTDYARAAKWYEQSAESGSSDAQYLLGYCLLNVKDFEEALKWFLLSANQGFVDAQSQIAWMYYEGLGGPKDLIGAYVWSNLAATASTGDKRKELEELRTFVSSQLSPKDLDSAQRRTREWRAQPNN